MLTNSRSGAGGTTRADAREPRVLFALEGKTIPATRFRVEQYLPYLRAAGIQADLRYGYGTHYNQALRLPRAAQLAYKIAGRLRKAAWLTTAPAYDLVFMQRNALPGTALPEQLLAHTGIPVIYDFDDAVHAQAYDGSGSKNAQMFRDMVALSTELVAGNDYMAGIAAAPEKTTVIPTAVDITRYKPADRRASDDIVIGWIGTRTNYPYIESIAPQLFEVLRAFPGARLRMISNGRSPVFEGHDRVEQVAWSEQTEIELLQSFDIGLMPLFDDEIARGKCGFKMLQYMAVGAPVVASRVGANGPLFEGSDGGSLVDPRSNDWVTPLTELLRDADLRKHQGASAREHVSNHYSAEKMAAKYLEVFRRALSHK